MLECAPFTMRSFNRSQGAASGTKRAPRMLTNMPSSRASGGAMFRAM